MTPTVTAENFQDVIRYQIARWLTTHPHLDIKTATVECANVFAQVTREKGHPEEFCRFLGETITRIGAEWAAELAIEMAASR